MESQGLAKTVEISKPVAVKTPKITHADGIVKTAQPQTKDVFVQVPQETQSSVVFSDKGVPLDVFVFYDKSFGKEGVETISQMKTIYEYAKSLSQDHKSAMRILAEFDLMNGAPSGGETRLSRAYNKARLMTIAKTLHKQRN